MRFYCCDHGDEWKYKLRGGLKFLIKLWQWKDLSLLRNEFENWVLQISIWNSEKLLINKTSFDDGTVKSVKSINKKIDLKL